MLGKQGTEYAPRHKYQPLQHLLTGCDQPRITLTFGQIEQTIGGGLPPSARKHQAWWANNQNGHSHCRAWLEIGWRTENLSIPEEKVDFVHIGPAHPPSAIAEPTPAPDPFGALAGSVTIHDPAALLAPSGEHWEAQKDCNG